MLRHEAQYPNSPEQMTRKSHSKVQLGRDGRPASVAIVRASRSQPPVKEDRVLVALKGVRNWARTLWRAC